MGRAPCCEKTGLRRGPWSPEEDDILISYIRQHGHTNWRALPKLAGLLRCGKSCRLRWKNYLRPDIKRGNFTIEEEETIIKLHEMLGNRWSTIAARLSGRTDNEIKNVWHTHLKKRLFKPDSVTTNVGEASVVSTNTKKRARKTKVTKTDVTSNNSKLEHVKCMDAEDVHNDSCYNNSNNSSSNNNNSVTDNDIIDVARPISSITRAMVFPQPCTSEMSTITSISTSTSASAIENEDNRDKENEEDKGDYFDHFVGTNNNFWMDVLPLEDTTMPIEDFPCASQYDQNTSVDSFMTEVMSESFSKVDGSDVGFFWYNLLTRSDELLELSEIL